MELEITLGMPDILIGFVLFFLFLGTLLTIADGLNNIAKAINEQSNPAEKETVPPLTPMQKKQLDEYKA